MKFKIKNIMLQKAVIIVISALFAPAFTATNTWTLVGSSTPYTNYPTGTNGTSTQERVGIGTTAAVSSQLYVLSQATNLIPFIVNTLNSPTVDIAEFQVNGSSKVVIQNSGNMGVGTTTPSYKLDVGGTFHVANGNQALFSNSGTAAAPSISFDNDQNTGLFNPGNADVIGFATQGAERMRIDQAGIVGIGTTNPASGYKLEVNGAVHITDGNQAVFSATNTANAPSISFSIDNNTGIFVLSEEILRFRPEARNVCELTRMGMVGIGITTRFRVICCVTSKRKKHKIYTIQFETWHYYYRLMGITAHLVFVFVWLLSWDRGIYTQVP